MSAAEIAQQLGGTQEGSEWRAHCPLCGRNTLTLRDGAGGLLLPKCFNGCTSKDVRAELRRRGLYNGKGNGAARPETQSEHEAKAKSTKSRRQRKINNGLDIWRETSPADDTLAATYLGSRLLIEPIPPTLRLALSLWHNQAKVRYPALIGLVEHEEHGPVGIHAIYLNPLDASVRFTTEPRKVSFGAVSGGAVRLAPAGPTLAVAEGIENALAFMQKTGTPSWAAISAQGIRTFVPPPVTETNTIILIEDQDQAGKDAVARAAQRLTKQGYTVEIARPVVGKDVNEALLTLGLNEDLVTIEPYLPAAADWYARCMVGSDGRTLCNVANALLALREDPAWKGVITRDGMLSTTLLNGRPITDVDIIGIQEWLQLAGLATVSFDTVYRAVEARAAENEFHPVKDYLEALTWDGTERLKDWLADCFGVAKTEYTMAVGTMFLIGMVARIFEPGCQSDYMLILEGPQGIRKSTACRVLADRWFSDDLPSNVTSKDAKLHLRGKWLVEIPELHTFNKSETTALKAFITRREDIYRPPYGRKDEHRPRQNLFVGSTNQQTYLQDETGARRFWPVLTTEINVKTLILQRDQLFAEAVVRYRRGEHWWPDPDFEAKVITPEQEQRFEADPWEEPIAKFLLENAITQITVYQLARDALFIETPRIGTNDRNRITAVLQHLGWKRGKRSTTGRPWIR
jgi:hypothetical protein